jgi:hypothetical protein
MLARSISGPGWDRGRGMATSAYPGIPAAEKIQRCGVIGTEKMTQADQSKNQRKTAVFIGLLATERTVALYGG